MLRHNPKNRSQSVAGFTLIEILLYIGIFSIMVGSLLLVTYNMVQGSGRIQSDVIINEEGTFILKKIYWALTGANNISVPSSKRLEITNPNFSAGENPLVFELSSGNILFERGSGGQVQLNTQDVEITALTFTKINGSGGSPNAAKIEFTVNHLSQNKVFDATKYLRL